MNKLRTTRRLFLKGAAGLGIGLPWLESFDQPASAQPVSGGPRRIIVVAYPMGVPQGAFRPSGSPMALPFVSEPLVPFAERCLFVSSLDHPMLDIGGMPFTWGHPAKKEAALTGTLTTGAFPATNGNQMSEVLPEGATTGAANGPSVEHLVGTFLRTSEPFASVDLGVDGDARNPDRVPPDSANSNFFFESAGNPISLNTNPSAAFDSLLAPLAMTEEVPTEAEIRLARLRARNKSVLDAVRESFNDLAQGVSADDRQRLLEHGERIRRLEIDVVLGESCSVPERPGQGSIQGLDMSQIVPLQNRILAHAMGCSLAPVGRLEYVNQENPRFGLAALDGALNAGGDTYGWHAMVHGDPLPGTAAFLRPGRGPELDYNPLLLDGYRFFVEQFAGLLGELDAIPEGPGTSVLDNSLVVLASDLGEGLGHGHMKMAYVLAGNLGGARRNFHFDAGPDLPFQPGNPYFYTAARYNVNQLLNSIADMAGVVDAAGNPLEVGLQGFLAAGGLPRRIDGLFA